MLGLKKNKALRELVDGLCKSLNRVEKERDYYKTLSYTLDGLHKKQTPQPTITLANNDFPKAVLANLVATHGVDSNDCKNHQRDRDNAMSGIIGAISVGHKQFHLAGKLNEYVIAELEESGYEIEFDDYGTIIRWGSAYLTP